MYFFGGGKQKKQTQYILELYSNYIEQVDLALNELEKRFPKNVEEEHAMKSLENPVHPYESKADDIRREIEHLMYGGMLLPDSRGDLLGLLETYDLLPNHAENIIEYFALLTVHIPIELFDDFNQMLCSCCDCVRCLNEGARLLFVDINKMMPYLDMIDELESIADKVERQLIRKIFSMDLGLAQKLLLKDIVETIASLSDLAENTADRLIIIASKSKA